MKHLLSRVIQWYCNAAAEVYSHESEAAYTHHRYHM